MKKKFIYLSFSIALALTAAAFFIHFKNQTRPFASYLPKLESASSQSQNFNTGQSINSKNLETAIELVGPRDNIPKGAPKEEGFWSFAIIADGKISRSGQPTIEEFRWLKENGWKADVNLRINGDHNELADDAQIPGFNDLGFNYLHLQIMDGAAPTDQQAEQFLKFATDSNNYPLLVHCRGGIGRAGTMVALYRYSVQSWPMDKAIEESKLFSKGISKSQQKWLLAWSRNHTPGSWTK